MKRFQLIAHVADIRLKVEGSSLEELFNAALEGMAHIIAPQHDCKAATSQKEISLESADTTALLIDFLSDVLTQTHLDKTVYCCATFDFLEPTRLKACILGSTVDAFDEDIKAVTYHEADVQKNKDGNFETMIVFDI